MSKQSFLVRSDIQDLLDTLSIQKGDHVCVQCSDAFCHQVIGGAQTIIEVLMDTVGSGGLLFMPTFTFSCLDPACQSIKGSVDDWKKIRENQNGYHKVLSWCDQNGELANQFLKYEGVIRTEHPVYSFAFWGFLDEKTADQKMNYPLSFSHVLRSFARNQGISLMLDMDPKYSVLIPAIAKTLNLGETAIQRAQIKKGSLNKVRTFLITKTPPNAVEEAMKYIHVKADKIFDRKITRLSLDEETE